MSTAGGRMVCWVHLSVCVCVQALLAKKAEEKAKMREAVRSMSREEQKKHDLKEAKKEKKNSAVRMKIKVG